MNDRASIPSGKPLLDRLPRPQRDALIGIGRLLAEIGIARADGTALPEGTVTSALSRARERAARAPALHAPAATGRGMQLDAEDCRAMQASAGRPVRAPNPGRAPPHPSSNPQPHRPPRGDHLRRPAPTQPAAGFGLPKHTRRAAALLEKLRSEKDEAAMATTPGLVDLVEIVSDGTSIGKTTLATRTCHFYREAGRDVTLVQIESSRRRHAPTGAATAEVFIPLEDFVTAGGRNGGLTGVLTPMFESNEIRS